MSVSVKTVVKGVKYDVDAIASTLKRFGLKQNVDFFVGEHELKQYRKNLTDKVGIWIEKKSVSKLSTTKGMYTFSEVGFRADENGDMEVIADDIDRRISLSTFKQGITKIVKVEALKKAARKKGHRKFFEVAQGNAIKLYVQ